MAFTFLYLPGGMSRISWFAILLFLSFWCCGLGIKSGREIGSGGYRLSKWMCGVERILRIRRRGSMRSGHQGIGLRGFGFGLFERDSRGQGGKAFDYGQDIWRVGWEGWMGI